MPDYSISRERLVSREEVSQLASEMRIIKENMAKIAVVLDQLSQAIVSLREQAAKTEAEVGELKLQSAAIKVHTDSLPHALREARRSDVSVQKTIADFSSRLLAIEARCSQTSADVIQGIDATSIKQN